MKKKSLLFSLISFYVLSCFSQKAFDEYISDKVFISYDDFTEKALPTEDTQVDISINTTTVINNVRTSLFGNNAVGWQGNLDTTRSKEHNWKNAQYSFLRYPGGNWSNIFFWDGNLPNSILNESTANGNLSNLKAGDTGWMLETDEFPELLSFTNSEGIVCVNVGYAFYGTDPDPVSTASQYAADWVNYYNTTLNLGIKYWELGNENYGPWQAGFDLANPEIYANACLEFANKMKAVDSSIKIGIVLYEGYGGFNNTPQADDWNEKVLPIVQDIMDYAVIHHYPHPSSNRNDLPEAEIYTAVSIVQETIEMMHEQTETYTNKTAGHYPIAITEFNSRTGVRELSRSNTLFTTLMLGEYSKYNDYGGVMQWDLQNNYDPSREGNHGAVATKDPFMADGGANSTLYVYYYMNRYFGNKLVESSSSNENIIVYPTTFSSGETGLVVVNKGNQDITTSISIDSSFHKGERMYWHTINGDESDFDRTLYVNNIGPSTTFEVGTTYTGSDPTISLVATEYEANGVGGPQNYTSILPFSSIISGLEEIPFYAPAHSASYIVFETLEADCSISNPECITAINVEKVEQINFYPNPTSNILYLSEKVKFTVRNQLGEILSKDDNTQIDFSNYNVGVYFIHTEFGTYKIVKK